MKWFKIVFNCTAMLIFFNLVFGKYKLIFGKFSARVFIIIKRKTVFRLMHELQICFPH